MSKCSLHPAFIFILGVVAGALIVGLIFTYGVVQSEDMENGFLRGIFHNRQQETMMETEGAVVPHGTMETTEMVETEGAVVPHGLETQGAVVPHGTTTY